MKIGTCARDRRALQQLVLNVHVKHSDLTWVCVCVCIGGCGSVCRGTCFEF